MRFIQLKQFIPTMKTILLTVVLFASAYAQQIGVSTRYWDCCKPSCSWDDKADVTRPVASCAADGYFPVPHHTTSGCEANGLAYTCNTNQPWAVNNNLAYGFAGAYIQGQGEVDWCCECYELTFTDEPVIGKRMIVQVTNWNGELGPNHFDIQIPGGGVGINNGCAPQWNAPFDGWGARYGGISNITECDDLPQQLHEGCRWRFQWFEDADNPSFTFIPVECPLELTSRSGCIRRENLL